MDKDKDRSKLGDLDKTVIRDNSDLTEDIDKTKYKGKLNIDSSFEDTKPLEGLDSIKKGSESNNLGKKPIQRKRVKKDDNSNLDKPNVKEEKVKVKKDKKNSNLSKGKKILKGLKIFLITLLILGLVSGGFIFLQVKPMLDESRKVAYDKLASVGNNTFTLMENTKVYDVKGDLIKEIKAHNYKYTPVNKVSKYIQDGYIAVEDRNFLKHKGIDFVALTRAGVALVKNDGKITQGGSTITQQVIKNMLLTQERTFERKLIEFFLAPEIEKKYSKADIMEFYVNTNYYGNGCYGVDSASKYYFGKTPDKLTLGEAAILVGVSNNPSKYNPVKYPENVIKKRNTVLDKMLEVEMITEKECNTAKSEELNLVLERMLSDGKEDYMTSYAIHSATLKVMELDGFKFKYALTDVSEYDEYMEQYNQKYSEVSNLVRSGGYKIYTSFDKEKQDMLQKSVDGTLKGFKEKDEISGKYTMQGAGVIVNNDTGLVEAMVGGRGTDDGFNRGFLGVRQPGSAIKPLVDYAPAFDSGEYYPSYVMEDKHIDKGPKNAYSGYRGNISLREAIKVSTNTIPYRMLLNMGTEKGLEYLAKMKFDTLTPSDNVGSLALGGITKGVRLVDMAKAYSAIANDGVFIDGNCLTKLEYGNSGVIYDGEVKKSRVFSEDTAYMLIDTLKGVLEEGGTGAKFKLENANAFAKTGTTNNNKDSYLVGSTPSYTLAVWTGYDMPKEIKSIREGYSGQIWKEVLDELHKGRAKNDFAQPSSIITANVDGSGAMTSRSTGRRDIFSQTAIEKQKLLEEERDRKKLAEIEKQWKEADKERQSMVESLLTEFESIQITTTDDLDAVDKKYRELETAIGLISDKGKKESYESRLDVKKTLLDREREHWEKLLEEEEKNRKIALQQKAEQDELSKRQGKDKAKSKLLSDANRALDNLKVLNFADSKKYYYVAQAEDAISRCYGYSGYDALMSELRGEKQRLKIVGLDIGDVKPSPPVNNNDKEDKDDTTNNDSSSNGSNNNNNESDKTEE